MIIVYQSLESTGTTQDTAGTVISGNSFKHQTQANASNSIYKPNNTNKSNFAYTIPTYDAGSGERKRKHEEIRIASAEENKALSSQYKKLKPEEQKKELKEFLEGVINTITTGVMNRTKGTSALASARFPDVIVLGEVSGSDILMTDVCDYKVVSGMNPTGDARHRFVVLQRNLSVINSGDLEILEDSSTSKGNRNEQSHCMMLKIMGWVIACVHIPNEICNDSSRVVEYLKNNVKRIGNDELDLVMGDTNQQSSGFITAALSGKLGGADWTTSIYNGQQELVIHGGDSTVKLSGTNSNFKKHFDVACSHHMSAIVQDEQVVAIDSSAPGFQPIFAFHGLTDKFAKFHDKLNAFSDHNGVVVEVLRRKDASSWNRKHLCPDCRRLLSALDLFVGRHVNCNHRLSIDWKPNA